MCTLTISNVTELTKHFVISSIIKAGYKESDLIRINKSCYRLKLESIGIRLNSNSFSSDSEIMYLSLLASGFKIGLNFNL